jgi:hypothetical protein
MWILKNKNSETIDIMRTRSVEYCLNNDNFNKTLESCDFVNRIKNCSMDNSEAASIDIGQLNDLKKSLLKYKMIALMFAFLTFILFGCIAFILTRPSSLQLDEEKKKEITKSVEIMGFKPISN